MGPLLAGRAIRFDYPPFEADDVDLLLVTHEHRDHNAVETIGGDPDTLRATACSHDSAAIGEVLGVASEHDELARTERGPNTIFAFELEGLRVAHFGDFGQRQLREEQAAAIGAVDLLFLPVGGGPTIGAARRPRSSPASVPAWRRCTTEPPATSSPRPRRSSSPRSAGRALRGPGFETADLPAEGGPIAAVPAAP